MVEELIVCIMGGNCENTIDMCIKSVKEANKIVFLFDKSSQDNSYKNIFLFDSFTLLILISIVFSQLPPIILTIRKYY